MTSRSLFQNFIHKTKIARYLRHLGRRETYAESVDRYLDFFVQRFPDAISPGERAKLRLAMLDQTALPSLNAWRHAGPDLEKNAMGAHDSVFIQVQSQNDLIDIFNASLWGVRVAFTADGHASGCLPFLPSVMRSTGTKLAVEAPQDRDHLCDAYAKLLRFAFRGYLETFDLPPEHPFNEFAAYAHKIFSEAAGRKLVAQEIFALVTYSFRVAQLLGYLDFSPGLAFTDPWDHEMAETKHPDELAANPHYATARTAILYKAPQHQIALREFDQHWEALLNSPTGERDIHYLLAAQQKAQDCGREGQTIQGLSACFTGDTEILTTRQGSLAKLSRLVGKKVRVLALDGRWHEATVKDHGLQNLCRIRIEPILRGPSQIHYEFKTTINHRWYIVDKKGHARVTQTVQVGDELQQCKRPSYPLPAKNLAKTTPDYLSGFFAGQWDNHYPTTTTINYKRYSRAILYKAVEIGYRRRIVGEKVSFQNESQNDVLNPRNMGEWLAGLFDAVGQIPTNSPTGRVVRVKSMDTVQVVKKRSIEAGWVCTGYCEHFQKGRMTYCLTLRPASSVRFRVTRFEPLPKRQRVFCPEVPGAQNFVLAGGIVTGNCGETPLRSYQGNNLSHVILRAGMKREAFIQAVKAATIFGTLQASLDRYPGVTPAFEKNRKDERFLGVCLHGMAEHSIMQNEGTQARDWLNYARAEVHKTNRSWAARLNIHPASAATALTSDRWVSKLAECSPGMDTPHDPFWIENETIRTNDPILVFTDRMGLVQNPHASGDKRLCVLGFPRKAARFTRIGTKQSAEKSYNRWHFFSRLWGQHCTTSKIAVHEDKPYQVGYLERVITSHFERFCGLFVLPHKARGSFEGDRLFCSKKEFEKAQKALPEYVNWDLFSESRSS